MNKPFNVVAATFRAAFPTLVTERRSGPADRRVSDQQWLDSVDRRHNAYRRFNDPTNFDAVKRADVDTFTPDDSP